MLILHLIEVRGERSAGPPLPKRVTGCQRGAWRGHGASQRFTQGLMTRDQDRYARRDDESIPPLAPSHSPPIHEIVHESDSRTGTWRAWSAPV